MEQTNAILEQAARRYTGIIGRLSPKARRGYILAATGETLPFHRNQVMGHSDPHPWRPRVGAKVLFDRELRPRGPWAVKVRPIGVV